MLFLPEIRLKKICDALIEYLVTDLEECLDSGEENKSYLYLFFLSLSYKILFVSSISSRLTEY